MRVDEVRAEVSRLTFDRGLIDEITALVLGHIWRERNECARVARNNGAHRIEQLILERNRETDTD